MTNIIPKHALKAETRVNIADLRSLGRKLDGGNRLMCLAIAVKTPLRLKMVNSRLKDNDRNEESELHDAKIAVFTATTTMWINDESFVLCSAKNSVHFRVV